MIQRRKAREIVLQALYAHDVSENDPSHVFNAIVKPAFKGKQKNFEFAEKLFFKITDEREELDDIIKEHIDNWRIDRLAPFDRAVLRLALCEFIYFEEIPTKVTINEAIEIAKNYSTRNSGKFINGILDSALERLEKEDKIHKTGRGLIESSKNS